MRTLEVIVRIGKQDILTRRIVGNTLIILIFVLVASFASDAFELDGLESGMSQQQVKEIVGKWSSGSLVEDRSHIHASRGDTWYSFDFCNGRLTQMAKGIKPSMKTFIIMFDDFAKAYGKPIEAAADRLAVTTGEEHYTLSFLWRAGEEYIVLTYSVFPENGSMDVYYHVPNRCFAHNSKYKKYFYSPK